MGKGNCCLDFVSLGAVKRVDKLEEETGIRVAEAAQCGDLNGFNEVATLRLRRTSITSRIPTSRGSVSSARRP